jgi:hypothetical protein
MATGILFCFLLSMSRFLVDATTPPGSTTNSTDSSNTSHAFKEEHPKRRNTDMSVKHDRAIWHLLVTCECWFVALRATELLPHNIDHHTIWPHGVVLHNRTAISQSSSHAAEQVTAQRRLNQLPGREGGTYTKVSCWLRVPTLNRTRFQWAACTTHRWQPLIPWYSTAPLRHAGAGR